jgi:hypothetical protein
MPQINPASVQLQSTQIRSRCYRMSRMGGSGWGICEGEIRLVKNNITGNIYMIRISIKTLISFMKRAIAEEDTFFGTKGQFVFIVGAEIRATSTTKNV